jgi:predicted sulfurtransferase
MITANNLADPGANWRIAAFYQFTALADPAALRPPIFEFCANLELKGTLLLAPEGINGTLAGSATASSAFPKTAARNSNSPAPPRCRSSA